MRYMSFVGRVIEDEYIMESGKGEWSLRGALYRSAAARLVRGDEAISLFEDCFPRTFEWCGVAMA